MVNDTTTTTTNKTVTTTLEQSEDDKRRIANIDNEIATIITIDKQLQEAQEHSRGERAKRIAKLLEDKFRIQGMDFLIGSIASEIEKLYRDNGIYYWHTVHRYLPEEYKQKFRTATHEEIEKSSIQSGHAGPNQLEQIYGKISEKVKDLPEKARDDFIRDWAEAAGNLNDSIREIATDYHVNILDPYGIGQDVGNSGTSSGNDEQISVIKPKPMTTIAYEEGLILEKKVHKFVEELRIYPPELESDLQFIVRGIKRLGELIEPSIDDKWTKQWLGWFKIEIDRLDYGKHAAAVRNFTETNQCAKCDDVEMVFTENSPSKMICPQCGNTQGLRRNMTREQVGDKAQTVMKQAYRFLRDIPDFAFVMLHHARYKETRMAKRKADLSPVLSDKA